MACVLQIGAGGVGGVVAHKMAMNREVFSHIVLASRTIEKCHAIAESIRAKGLGEIVVDSVDADNIDSVVSLIEKHKPKLVVNVALPYQDLSIMEACLRTKTHYLDTANYEHPDSAHFEYKEQWAYDCRYKKAGIFALLGSGFDPGVTNVFCAYAQKHYFDEIESIDILDCNAGDHGYAFATNFNPEINLREVSSKARYWVKDDLSLTQSLNECCNSTSVTTDKVAPLSHFAQHSNLTQDTRIAEISNGDSKSPLVLPTDLALNPDLKQDTIYRKFEREEQHWRAEVERKEQERAMQKAKVESSDSIASERETESSGVRIGNSNILSEKCDLQGKSQKSYQTNTAEFNKTSYGGEWRDIAPLALMKEWNYPEVGVKNSYLLYHEELESLVRNIRGLKRIRFFMTFGESYLTHMKVLENIGFLRIDEVMHKGQKIVPLEVLKTLLPDPASLASRTKGQTHIGCYIKGRKDGKERTIYIYNICEHEACYKEVNAQGVSYTTGVPAMIGAKLICEGKWGIGAIKNSSLGSHSADFENFKGSQTQSLASPSKFSKNYESNTANTRILDSSALDSQSCHSEALAKESKCQDSVGISESAPSDSIGKIKSSIKSYNAQRLRLNADMPKGGEYQGIDNAAELCVMESKGQVGGSCGVVSESKEQSSGVTAESKKQIDKDVRNSKIFGEKCGLQEKGRGSYLEGNDRNTFSPLPHLSQKAEFQGSGVWNMEQNDPDPFMSELNKQGLPYVVIEIESSGKINVLEDGRK